MTSRRSYAPSLGCVKTCAGAWLGVISPQTTMPVNMGLVLTDVEIDGKNAGVAAWAFGAVTCVRCNVYNVARGFQYAGYTVIDSYIHDLWGAGRFPQRGDPRRRR